MDYIVEKKYVVVLVFFICFLPRLIGAVNSLHIPNYDESGYDRIAMNIVDGKGISLAGKATSYKEPAYSIFLAGIYRIFGHNYMAARFVQALIGTFTCFVVYLIALRMFRKKIAFFTFLIAGFYPPLVKISEYLLAECLFIFLFTLSIWWLLKIKDDPNLFKFFILGIFWAIAILTRSVIFLFPLATFIFVKRFYGDNFRRYLQNISIVMLAMIIIFAPWIIRNYKVHGAFVPLSTRGGTVMYSSYVPEGGKFYGYNTTDDTVRESLKIESEVGRSSFLIKKTLEHIKKYPVKVLKLEVWKLMYFFSVFDWEVLGYGVYNFMFVFMIPFFVAGSVILFKRKKEIMILYIAILYFIFMALISYGSPRFRMPAEPYFIIFAAYGLVWFYGKFKNKVLACFLNFSYLGLNYMAYLNSGSVKDVIRNIFHNIGLW